MVIIIIIVIIVIICYLSDSLQIASKSCCKSGRHMSSLLTSRMIRSTGSLKNNRRTLPCQLSTRSSAQLQASPDVNASVSLQAWAPSNSAAPT